jgi:hypothetical protein
MVRSREGGWCLELGHLLIELMYGAVWEELDEEVQYQIHDSSLACGTIVRYRLLSLA